MSSPRRNRRSSVQQVKVLPPPITAATTEADIPSWVVQNLATKFQKDPDEISSLLLKDPTLVKTLLAGDPFNVSSSKQDDHDSSFTHTTTRTPVAAQAGTTSDVPRCPLIHWHYSRRGFRKTVVWAGQSFSRLARQSLAAVFSSRTSIRQAVTGAIKTPRTRSFF